MASITLLILQGLERGQLYSNLKIPVTIGREEDNTIQLNDERISRCHVKIQQDEERIILTDLQSTNGTRVNGLPVQMTILRPGDLIAIGRCVLLFGSREEIRKHCHELHRRSLEAQCLLEGGMPVNVSDTDLSPAPESHPATTEMLNLFDQHGQPAISFPGGRPPLPSVSSLLARSELADMLSYFHSQILKILESRGFNNASSDSETASIPMDYARIPWPLWFQLLDLEADLSHYLKEIPEPE